MAGTGFSAADAERWIPRLRRYAQALTGQREAADDLIQDTLERAWRKRALWQPGTDLRAWLFTVMHNVHVNRARAARPTESLDENGAAAATVAALVSGSVGRKWRRAVRASCCADAFVRGAASGDPSHRTRTDELCRSCRSAWSADRYSDVAPGARARTVAPTARAGSARYLRRGSVAGEIDMNEDRLHAYVDGTVDGCRAPRGGGTARA